MNTRRRETKSFMTGFETSKHNNKNNKSQTVRESKDDSNICVNKPYGCGGKQEHKLETSRNCLYHKAKGNELEWMRKVRKVGLQNTIADATVHNFAFNLIEDTSCIPIMTDYIFL